MTIWYTLFLNLLTFPPIQLLFMIVIQKSILCGFHIIPIPPYASCDSTSSIFQLPNFYPNFIPSSLLSLVSWIKIISKLELVKLHFSKHCF